jgi:hypothetical protein
MPRTFVLARYGVWVRLLGFFGPPQTAHTSPSSVPGSWGFLALGCVMILRKEIAAHESPDDHPAYREHVLALLSDSIELMTGQRPG